MSAVFINLGKEAAIFILYCNYLILDKAIYIIHII